MKTLVATGDLPERRPDWVPLSQVVSTATTTAGRCYELNVTARSSSWAELDVEGCDRRIARYLNS